jgi:hypothetical protein
MDIIKNKGSPEDKMRLFLVWYLSLDAELPAADFSEYVQALREAACDVRPIEFVKR